MATDRSIDAAKTLHFQGRTAEAETLYRELLAARPNALDALEGLGVLVFQRGDGEEASRLFARAVAIDPSSSRAHANLGEALRTIRRLDQAREHLRTAAALDPTNVQAWNSLGLVALDARRSSAAEHAFREAIRLEPRFVHAYINLANTLLARGRSPAAADVLRTALGIEPNNLLALVNLGRILCETTDATLLSEAETTCRRAVTVAPRFPMALLTLAAVLKRQGRIDEAIDLQRRASKLDPGGAARAGLERAAPVPIDPTVEAGDPPRPASQTSPAQAHLTRGLAHLAEGQLDPAEHWLRQALTLDSTMADAWVALAGIQAQRGDFELSCQSARAALSVRPGAAEAYWRLATNLLGRLPDSDVTAMEALQSDESLSNGDRAFLHFALATVLDQRGLYDQAAAHHAAANLQQSAGKLTRGLVYNPDRHSRFIDGIIAGFNAGFLAQRREWGDPDPRPVFVVGFPRSGTTLTEQIIASHSQATGVGELQEIQHIFQSLPTIVGLQSGDSFDALGVLSPASARAAARRYLDTLDELAPTTAARVVDKMPDNIIQLGLIALLFPRARVILCHRDPRDIAVSCWQTNFRTSSWNNDWDHIARRLADYQRLVKHWKHVPTLTYLDLSYEDIVACPEQHARRLMDFVGLDWEPACLAFHANGLVVRTPSFAQVRQPIYSRSSGRWRHYEASLRTMFQAFERHGVEAEDRD